jgi:PII-like signaling protein
MEPGRLPAVARRVRIYIGESDHHGRQPLYMAIVEAARQAGLAGASVFKGIEGFGGHHVVHAARIVDLSSDLPILVELVDEPARIDAFLPQLGEMLAEGLVTVEDVQVVYRGDGRARA